jgi:hypothetical protein
MKGKQKKKIFEPIKDLPLHNPGQSLEEELNRVIDEGVMTWGIVAVFAAVLVFLEWWRWFFSLGTSPVWITVVGLTVIGVAAVRLVKMRRHIKNLQTGLIGERSVGQYLQNALLRKNYWIVHDVCEDDYNIDHVLIGPGGVFSIETKTRKKSRPDARVDYDGKQVTVDGWVPDRDPVAQAQACAARLQRILLEETGVKVSVRSVVLFPGWYVNEQPKGVETWVLNEKSFVKFLDYESDRLSPEETFKLAAGLGRYVRRKDGEQD